MFRNIGCYQVNVFKFAHDEHYSVWVTVPDKDALGVGVRRITAREEFATFEEAWEYYNNDAVVLL